MQKKVGSPRKKISLSNEVRLRNDIFRFTQKQHLAASLFSLDEIAIPPKVLTPLIQAQKSIELEPTDSVSLTVPYTPDWPEMAAVYRAPTLTLTDALQGGANIILAGHPGSGKTVALAWLASSIIRNEPGLGNLVNFLPLYVHATEIYHILPHKDIEQSTPTGSVTGNNEDEVDLPSKRSFNRSDCLDILTRAISTYASPLTLSRLPGVVQAALDKQRAILILDRLDEMPPAQSRIVTHYLDSLLQAYPKLRIVAALSYEDLAGLPVLGFSLLGLAAWTNDDRDSFLERWSQNWDKWINPTAKSRSKRIYSYYIKSWLKVNNALLNPLEYMLKVWAAYAGDATGTDAPSAIEAYIRRMTGDSSKIRPSLELFALQLLYEIHIFSSPHDSDRIFKEQDNDEPPSLSDLSENDDASKQSSVAVKPARIKALSDLDDLAETGFLVNYPGSNYGFSHPTISGFLAANALASTGTMERIQNQPPWIGKTLAMYYFSRVGDVAPYINAMLQEDDILHTNHLKISRWLQVAPKNRQWRSTILRTLTTILAKEKDTLSLSAKIISAMAFSGDVGVSVYFRQLLKSENSNLMQLAALGCGILAETKAIDDLNALTQDPSPTSVRAGSLALAAIGDKRSLEILAGNLLNGSELSRRYAAEALANNPAEGHPALKDGSSMEDLLVRRSVAFGLIRVNQPWAVKIVENMQLVDNEWVVRNAAIQAFSELQRRISYAPAPMGDPTETQWLIDYAAKIGTTVAPGRPADELVLKALSAGTDDEILNALDYLRQKCDPETVADIYRTYSQKIGEIKDTAYYVMWLMMIAGIKLPVSIKYNIE